MSAAVTKVRIGLALSFVGGLVMFSAGVRALMGHTNNLLFLLGFGLMVVGMGLRGLLTKKL